MLVRLRRTMDRLARLQSGGPLAERPKRKVPVLQCCLRWNSTRYTH